MIAQELVQILRALDDQCLRLVLRAPSVPGGYVDLGSVAQILVETAHPTVVDGQQIYMEGAGQTVLCLAAIGDQVPGTIPGTTRFIFDAEGSAEVVERMLAPAEEQPLPETPPPPRRRGGGGVDDTSG